MIRNVLIPNVCWLCEEGNNVKGLAAEMVPVSQPGLYLDVHLLQPDFAGIHRQSRRLLPRVHVLNLFSSALTVVSVCALLKGDIGDHDEVFKEYAGRDLSTFGAGPFYDMS